MQETCYNVASSWWASARAACISHQVDFLQGDGNLFPQRNDDHSDFRSCILVDLLERFLGQIKMHRSALNRITFSIVSSTRAGEYIEAQQGDLDADCDSMILISVSTASKP